MAASTSGGIDPRFPEAFQRGGSAAAVDAPRAGSARPPAPELDDGLAVGGVRPSAPRTARDAPAGVQAAAGAIADEKHFEIIVAGNPWLRALWCIGAVATVIGLSLTVYAEFAFSVPPSSGIYDPAVYVVPRIAEELALPLVIAGVVALAAAACLRIVAWRPTGARAVTTD